jgi:hypothetical protein
MTSNLLKDDKVSFLSLLYFKGNQKSKTGLIKFLWLFYKSMKQRLSKLFNLDADNGDGW